MAEQEIVADVVADKEPIAGILPLSIGLGSVLRIPVPGTRGLAIELTPRGWTPKGGSTSSLFFQDMTGKRHLRLDYGFNKKSTLFEWHWNQKGTAGDFGITNHTSVGAAEQFLGQGAKIYRYVGRAFVIAGVAMDVYSVVVSEQPLRRSVQLVAGWAGATGGCKVLGASGAYLGTAVAPGVGTAVGGFLGCSIGSFIGYMAADETAGHLFDWTKGARFNKLRAEAPLPLPKGNGFRGGGGMSGGGGATGYW
jgi:hypothetical protein